MPDRIIRDELLTSERYWSVSVYAQRLYVHLLLQADDAARFSGKSYTIRASCFPGQLIEPAHLEKWLAELMDADLIRLYEFNGERYVFIPRFQQRMRYNKRSKFPPPPNEINDLPEEKSDSSQTQDGPESDLGLTQVSRREEKRSEEKRSESESYLSDKTLVDSPARDRLPPCPFDTLVEAYHKHCPTLPRVLAITPARKRSLASRWREVLADHKDEADQVGATLAWFDWFFQQAGSSAFLSGRAKDWRANLDWLLYPRNFVRVAEGYYRKEKQ